MLGTHIAVTKVRGSRRDGRSMFMSLLMADGYGLTTDQALGDCRIEDRADATMLLRGDSVLVNPSIQRGIKTTLKRGN